ncbi:protoporphyrinogen/coproporphyrinogen oxidase [Micrococcus luteus]
MKIPDTPVQDTPGQGAVPPDAASQEAAGPASGSADGRGTALVIGGGISGLLSALRLRQAGWDVTLAEATSVLGGAVSPRYLTVPSVDEHGAPQEQTLELDGGAEAFALRGTAVQELLHELGIYERIMSPAAGRSWIHSAEGSFPSPRLGLLGIPGDLDAEDTAAALSADGLARARQDLTAPVDAWAERIAAGEEITLGELVADRLGHEVLQRLVTPVVAGVHSADPSTVDVRRVAPGLLEAFVEQGSLSAGVAALRGQHTPGSLVAGLDGGMNILTARLVSRLRDTGVTVLRGVRVAALKHFADRGQWWAQISDRNEEVLRGLEADRVVLAVDGPNAWQLLAPASHGALDPDDGPHLADGVALVTLVVDAAGLDSAPRGTGLLVAEGTTVGAKALTHATAKWEWLAEVVRRDGADGAPRHRHRHVLRLSYGRHGGGTEQLGFRTEDERLVEQAIADAAVLTGVELAAEDVAASMVVRWRDAIPPQSGPARTAMRALTAYAEATDGVDVVGAWSDGTGLASIVAAVDRRFGSFDPITPAAGRE